MNVLFLTFTYPTRDEPTAGIFVREHARAAARHAEVAVVHLQRGGGPYAIEKVADEEFRTLRVRYPRSPLAYPRHFAGAAAAIRRLRRAGFEPDLIHAHVFLAALPPLLLRRPFGVPVVVSEHWSVFLPEDPLELSRPVLAAARAALPRAAAVLPVSEALRAGMEAHGIRARYEVVPNAVDTDVFRPGEVRGERLLTVGGLYEAKRLDVMLEALALLPRGIGLDVVGDGPLRARHEALAQSLGLAEAVAFHGYRPKEDVARMMREAAAFVLASDFETGSCVLIEAAASGAPIVSTAAGATPEIVAATGGLLADRGSPESLAAQIAQTLEATPDRQQIARRACDRYSLERVGAQLRGIYERSVGSDGPRWGR